MVINDVEDLHLGAVGQRPGRVIQLPRLVRSCRVEPATRPLGCFARFGDDEPAGIQLLLQRGEQRTVVVGQAGARPLHLPVAEDAATVHVHRHWCRPRGTGGGRWHVEIHGQGHPIWSAVLHRTHLPGGQVVWGYGAGREPRPREYGAPSGLIEQR